jgi:hypothetical protein
MREFLRHRSRMREQGHALAFEGRAQGRFAEEPIDSEFHVVSVE